jgi:lysophospholipid acyltransferase (LPLAT)-like uncharacterized protein
MRTLVPLLVAVLVRRLRATLRVTLSGVAPLSGTRNSRSSTWCGTVGPWLNAQLRASHGARAPRVLVSLSPNMARFVSRFGLDVVRGSSAGGAETAMRALAAARPR